MIDVKKYKNMNRYEIDDMFVLACKSGDLSLVKYLLTNPGLKENANIFSGNQEGFLEACQNGYLDIVKYLLTSPELKEHVDIHYGGNIGFRIAFSNGRLGVVKYLLTSPELKEHADIHAANDDVFCMACFTGDLEGLKFLIFDMGIKKTEKITEKIKGYQKIEMMFKERDIKEIKESLESSLENKTKVKRLKI
jgi:hypothetical protein